MSKNGSKTTTFIAILIAGVLTPLCFAIEGPSVEEGRAFWAFQSIADPPVPKGEPDQHPIDAFRADTTLEGCAPLSPNQLVRKLYLDLHGLPPSPPQIDAFLADSSPQAYEHLIDELLSSRRFAERWARHWLSVVRYADSTGGGRAILLKEAWRYRDYVVDSFHSDRPYAEFITEQIAGDLLERTDPESRRESIIAAGFLALGPTNYELQNKEQLRMDVIDEQIDTIGRAFMGMSLGCARCHDHFFDPIPTSDYYALAGIFRSTKTLAHSNVSAWITTDLPPITDYEHRIIRERLQWEERVGEIRSEIAAIKQAAKPTKKAKLVGIVVDDDAAVFEGSWTVSKFTPGFVGDRYLHDNAEAEERRVTFRRHLPADGEYEVRIAYTASANRAPSALAIVRHADGEEIIKFDQRKQPAISGFRSLGSFRFERGRPAELLLSNSIPGQGYLIADAVAFVQSGDIAKTAPAPAVSSIAEVAALKRKQLEAELKELEKARPEEAPFAMSVVDEKEPADYAINIGGNSMNLGETVPRGFLRVMDKAEIAPPNIPTGRSGRLEFARWLTAPEHPLVARVYANRIWHWLTGTGIVASPDNFGSTGSPPSNPVLLDHLASRLLAGGGSTKQLVRHIVTSRSYRSATASPRRIDAETLRDTMLAVSGELDLRKDGGPAIKKGTGSEFGYRFDRPVRSIYTPIFRNNLPELFEVFDFPDPSLSLGDRADTTLATQALFMMNHPWVISRAMATAKRWIEMDGDMETKIAAAYKTTLSRKPTAGEQKLASDFLGTQPSVERWTAFQQTLFACIDFRYY